MAAPQVDNEYRNEITKARVELQELLKNHNAWDMLRLAYASQFSIAKNRHVDARTSTSTDATTNNTQSAINNLKIEIESIKGNHLTIARPDLYQLAGVVALHTLGGPVIEFVPGRKDSTISPDEGCLPDVYVKDPSDLRDVFHQVEIRNSNHIVALCGGLKLARRAGAKTLQFDNSYFKELNDKEPPIDKALRDDQEFHNHVQCYAMDEDAFKRDYEAAHKKLSEFGLPHSAFDNSTLRLKNMPVTATQRAVGVAVAAVVAIFSVFYLINRRRGANKYSSQQFH